MLPFGTFTLVNATCNLGCQKQLNNKNKSGIAKKLVKRMGIVTLFS